MTAEDGILERELYPDGTVRHEGRRTADGAPHGLWRYHDRNGVLRRESRFEAGAERERTWHRTVEESGGNGISRRGPVDEGVEIGAWRVLDAGGEVVDTIDLGPRVTAAALLADPVAIEETTDDDSDRYDRRHVLARIRTCGRTEDLQMLRSIGTRPAWPKLDREGNPSSLGDGCESWVELLDALIWGPPDAAILGALAAALFRGQRPHAALDVIDAALLVEDTPALRAARADYLRALGRGEEDAQEAAGDPPLDERAERLLMQIRAAPDDDGPRLVFADHIAQSWPEHTTLIVAQCRAEQPLDPAIWAAFRRTLPASLGSQATRLARGFLDAPTLTIDAERFLLEHELLFRVAPACTGLVLAAATDHMGQLSGLPALRRYDRLSFKDTDLSLGGVEHLARSPHLAHLRYLDLDRADLNDDELRSIVAPTAFPHLEGLDLGISHGERSPPIRTLRALPDAAFAGTLRTLEIDRWYLGDDVVDVIARLPRLVELSIKGNQLTDDGLRRLAELPHRFTALALRDGRFGDGGAIALAASPAISELRELSIAADELGEPGVSAIVRSPSLGALRRLYLHGTMGSDGPAMAAVAGAFADARFLRSLEGLNLGCARIGPGGAAQLARTPFERLAWLDLCCNDLGDDGVIAIARSPLMAKLSFLGLDDNKLTDEAALALAGAAHANPELSIELDGADLSETTQTALLRRFGCRVDLGPS